MPKEDISENKKNMGAVNKARLIIFGTTVALIVIVSIVYGTVAKQFFLKSAAETLDLFCKQTQRVFMSDLQSEVKLSLQMAKSVATLNFCKNPDDPEAKALMDEEMKSYASSLLSGSTFYMSYSNMHFWSTDGTNYIVDSKLPENYWANLVLNLKESEKYNFNINYNPELKSINLWVNVPVRDAATRKVIGLVGTGIPLSVFTKSIYEGKNPLIGLYIFNDEREIVGAEDVSLIENKTLIQDVLKPQLNEFITKVLDSKQRKPVEKYSTSDSLYYMAHVEDLGWNIFAYKEGNNKLLYTGIGVVIYFIVIIAFILVGACIYVAVIKYFKMRENEQQLGSSMFEATQNLVVSARETAATSQDQSAAVKEIVATMEDSNNLSENIASKINDVADVAKKTSADVEIGGKTLIDNVNKLNEIFEANTQTINGIKALSEKIDNIWDIVTLINSVADQAKIIAFNAELEAASAGEAGKNFHIVASEIRRLADGIIDGTKEIKERITEIQHSSDVLILASESGTEKINEGCERAHELEANFESIRAAAEITSDSASEITNIIQQQTAASGQILVTLKQIAAGVENFTSATESVSSSAEQLKEIANKLNEQVAEANE